MPDKLIIFDTTLRDGEQSPGASMTGDEKVRIAKCLQRLRVDVIEAGFPIASDGDFQAVQAVSGVITDSIVCGLARALKGDIDRAGEALKTASRSRIHTFIATSPIHMRAKLNMSSDEVLDYAVAAVQRARKYTDDVEFSAEDAGRSSEDFLCRIIEAVIKAGATTINIPDTVGYSVPQQFGNTIANLRQRIPNSAKAIFSVHCHNDLGLAVANSLAAVLSGARQVECTINGLGERAGNASLEEVVMAVTTRPDVFNCKPTLDNREILNCSKLVSSITGFAVQPNKAIVGANAFAHEAGIHQDGVLKHRATYEIMRAQDVGWSTNKIVLGKHSGCNAFQNRMAILGHKFANDQDLHAAFTRFKQLADKKHEIVDEDLQTLISFVATNPQTATIELLALSVSSTMGKVPCATIQLRFDNKLLQGSATGSGAVDAALRAIESLLVSGATLALYSVNNISDGTDAQGEVSIRLEKDGYIVNGQGVDTDIVIASAKAYINAIGKLQAAVGRQHPQKGAV